MQPNEGGVIVEWAALFLFDFEKIPNSSGEPQAVYDAVRLMCRIFFDTFVRSVMKLTIRKVGEVAERLKAVKDGVEERVKDIERRVEELDLISYKNSNIVSNELGPLSSCKVRASLEIDRRPTSVEQKHWSLILAFLALRLAPFGRFVAAPVDLLLHSISHGETVGRVPRFTGSHLNASFYAALSEGVTGQLCSVARGKGSATV